MRALISTTDSDSVRITTLGELAFHYTRLQTDSAVAIAERAYSLAVARGSDAQLSQAANDRGAAYLAAGQFSRARESYREAIGLRLETGDEAGVAGSRTNLGSVYQRMGKLDSAILEYRAAAEVFEKTGNAAYLDYVRNNTAVLYEDLGALDQAIEAYHKVLAFRTANAGAYQRAVAHNNLGGAQARVDSFDAARNNYLAAVRLLADDEDEAVMVATLYNNLSGLAHRRGDESSALRYGKLGLAVAEDAGATVEQGLLHYGIGNSYRDLGQTRRAYDAFRRAAGLFGNTGDVERLADMKFNLAVLAGQLGKREESDEYALAYRDFVDSVNQAGTADRVLELETKYETAQKEQALAQTEAARLAERLQARQQLLWLLAALALALVLGLLGYVLYSQQRVRNQQLAQQAELDLALARLEAQSQLQEQRLQISRDLHDNIGAQLSFIISGVDTVRQGSAEPKSIGKLGHLSEFAGSTMRDLRDTVWAMNKEAITVEDLRERLTNFVARARASGQQFEFAFNVDQRVDPTKRLPAREGMNVYRILQEAVHNAVKYSEGTRVEVRVQQQSGRLEFEVKDNGRGFTDVDVATAEARGGGSGMHTMRARAEALGSALDIKSRPAVGTTIKWSVPELSTPLATAESAST